MRIAVLFPTHNQNCAQFTFCLANLMGYLAASLPDGWDVGLHMVQGTYVHQARIDLAKIAVHAEADAMLWLDADMTFPKDLFHRLWSRNLPVVGINYAQRAVPSDYVAIKSSDPPTKCRTTEDSTGVEEVDALGFGGVLIRAEALRGLPDPDEVPWFQNVHLGNGRWMGEDVWFCKLLRESGIKIHVDHDTSKLCQHVGSFEYDLSMVA